MVFSWLLSIESWSQSSFLPSLQTIERGPRAPPAGGGRSGDGSGPESAEGRARPDPESHREN